MPTPPSTWNIQSLPGLNTMSPMVATMYLPSGVQVGDWTTLSRSLVICRASFVSTFWIQTFSAPSRSDVKASHFPSGL
jgi:hypothetical protein